MTAAELIHELGARGVTVEPHGEHLRVVGAISDSEVAALREHKVELLTLLRLRPQQEARTRTYPLYSPPRNRCGLTDADIEADKLVYDNFIARLRELEISGMSFDAAFALAFAEFDRGYEHDERDGMVGDGR